MFVGCDFASECVCGFASECKFVFVCSSVRVKRGNGEENDAVCGFEIVR